MPGSTFGQGVLCGVQGIGQSLGSGTGAQGFWLGVGRGPAGEADGFERGGDSGVLAVGMGIDLGGTGEDGAFGGVAQALGQGIVFTHDAQVVHEMGHIAIQDGAAVGVGDGQGKTGALQQGTEVTNLTHGQDAGGQAMGDFGFSLGEGGAELKQGLAAKGEGDEQPVGFERTTALDQLAHRIMRPVQAEGVDDEVVGGICQV